jgi:putative transposase
MPNAYTPTSTIELTDMERAELTSMARSRSLPTALSLRARIVLACEGPDKASTDVATTLGIDRNTVNKWRARYARIGSQGCMTSFDQGGRARSMTNEWQS